MDKFIDCREKVLTRSSWKHNSYNKNVKSCEKTCITPCYFISILQQRDARDNIRHREWYMIFEYECNFWNRDRVHIINSEQASLSQMVIPNFDILFEFLASKQPGRGITYILNIGKKENSLRIYPRISKNKIKIFTRKVSVAHT